MKNKVGKIITVFIMFSLVVVLFAATFICMPKEKKVFSENENRYLLEFPKLSFETVVDKSFMQDFEEWFSDRFFWRIQWIYAKNSVEKLIGKQEINGTYMLDDRLLEVFGDYDEEKNDERLSVIDSFSKQYDGVQFYMLMVPTALGIYEDELLDSIPVNSENEYIKNCYEALENVECVDICDELYSHRDEYIYYRLDHHWTSLGAYYAYAGLGEALGYEAYSMEQFDVKCLSTEFRGTLYSKTLFMNMEMDSIDGYTLENEPKVEVSVITGNKNTEYDSLYFDDYLETKDKYSYFLGNNAGIVDINTDIDNKKSLLVIKDSYANCLIPFLKNHYSKITVVDLRYIKTKYTDYFDVNDYDQVLFLYNCITFSEDTGINRLKVTD